MKNTLTFVQPGRKSEQNPQQASHQKVTESKMTDASDTKVEADLRDGCVRIAQPPFQSNDPIS